MEKLVLLLGAEVIECLPNPHNKKAPNQESRMQRMIQLLMMYL